MQIVHRLSILSILAATFLLSGQTGTSAFTGTVTDPAGAAVPQVAIQVLQEESGSKSTTVTNEAGVYRVPSLPPGRYRIEAELPGFERIVRQGITLAVSQTVAIDLALTIGKSTETITIEANAPLIESQSSSTAQLISRKQVERLPLPNRAATSLVALAPGVVMIDSGQGAENYPVFSVAGGRARNQNFTLDGGNVTNAVGLTRPQQQTSLPLDAMQEFRVITNNYAAEYGHSTGGVITLSTRSGTNAFHGSLFEYLRNSALDARNFFAVQRPPLRQHQFGGAFGGPIQKNKTHFFVSWEQTRQLTSTATVQTVPTLAQRAGDFSGLRDASGNPVLIYDPASTNGRDRQPFVGNVIPPARFDPVARAAIDNYPLPNRVGTATGASNFSGNNNSSLHRDIVVGKVDHQLRPQDLLSARYYINDNEIGTQGAWGRPAADPDSLFTEGRIQSILGTYTKILRPSLVNELRVGYVRRKYLEDRFGAGTNLAGTLGLTGVSDAAFPIFTLPGYAGLGGSPYRHQTPITDTQVLDAVSYTRGTHAFKGGVEFRQGTNSEQRDRNSAGTFGISPLITGKPGVAGTGNALASLLLGEVNSASVLVSDQIPSRAAYWAGYVQDDWRITTRLTLNYGLRWEAELPRYVEGDRQNSFDPVAINPVSGTPGVVTFSGRNGVPRRAFAVDTNNFGPRLGFAWQPNFLRNTVVRGGGGVFYGPTVSNSIGDVASTGFSTSVSLVTAQADLSSALRLRDGFPVVARPPLDAGFGAAAPGQKPYTSVGYFDPHQPTPLSYQYNLNIQREVLPNLLIEAGYLANVSHHLTGNDLSLNQVRPELMGPGDAQARRPFPQFSNVYLINPALGNSTYHAGFIKAEQRFAHGLSFLVHYTFSKFIDDVASANEYGDPASYMDAYNRRLDKSLSGTDVPHRLVISGVYELPHWRSHSHWETALGAWRLGLFTTLQSGPPFTVVMAANTTNAFSAGPLRPDLVGNPQLPEGQQTLARWFDTKAYQPPAPYRFGNSPRSGLRGAPLQTVDLTLAKDFAWTERVRFDIRGEFYNLLNHANFNVPGHTLGAADFGVVSSALPARTVQLGARLSF